jgi:hypothetical protein
MCYLNRMLGLSGVRKRIVCISAAQLLEIALLPLPILLLLLLVPPITVPSMRYFNWYNGFTPRENGVVVLPNP